MTYIVEVFTEVSVGDIDYFVSVPAASLINWKHPVFEGKCCADLKSLLFTRCAYAEPSPNCQSAVLAFCLERITRLARITAIFRSTGRSSILWCALQNSVTGLKRTYATGSTVTCWDSSIWTGHNWPQRSDGRQITVFYGSPPGLQQGAGFVNLFPSGFWFSARAFLGFLAI